jgi:O-antigen/teichoic acid export membrane protein
MNATGAAAPRSSDRQLTRNSAAYLVFQGWNIARSLIVVPVILHFAGLEQYGVWVLLFAISAYLDLAGFGFGAAFARQAASARTREDLGRLAGQLGTVSLALGALLAVSLAVTAFFGEPVLAAFGVPPGSPGAAAPALLLVVSSLGLRALSFSLEQSLVGFGRMDVVQWIGIGGGGLEIVLQVVLLAAGFGVPGLAAANLVASVVRLLLVGLRLRPLLPGFVAGLVAPRLQGMDSLIWLAMKFQGLNALAILFFQGARSLTSATLGLETLGLFHIGIQLCSLGAMIPTSLIAPLMAAFAEAHGAEDGARAVAIHRRAVPLLSIAVIGCFAAFFVVVGPFVGWWLGARGAPAVEAARILAVGMSINLLTGIATAHMRGQSLFRLEYQYAVAQVALLFLLLPFAARQYGLTGCAWAFAVAQGLPSLWLLFAYSRGAGRPMAGLMGKAVLWAGSAAAIAVLAAAGLLAVATATGLTQGRAGALATVGLVGLLFVGGFLPALRFLSPRFGIAWRELIAAVRARGAVSPPS